MKNWTRLALFSSFISLCLHFYLLMHFYPLRFGFAKEASVCNVNQTFNCDSVSTSIYADIFGIPMAGFGFVVNTFLFVLILLGWLNWSDDSKKFRSTATQLSLFSAAVSLVMLVISFTALKQYCLVCMALHGLAFVILFANIKIEPLSWGDWSPTQHPGLKTGVLVGIPLLAFIMHKSYLQSYGADEIQRIIQNVVSDWQTEKPKSFSTKPLLSKGAPAESAKMVIREFADLLCHHCKMAAPSLSAFADSHSDDVRMEFYLFPLDGNCNPEMSYSSGLSCALARILVCAEQQNLGWQVQEKLFEKQEDLMTAQQPEEITTKALQLFDGTKLDQQKIKDCIKDPGTNTILVDQSKQGKAVNVEGTPTVFVADKKLSRGQLIPVLQEVYNRLTSAKP